MANNGGRKFRLQEWISENLTWILALVFAIVNLWLTTQLAPLAQGIKVLETKVEAITDRQNKTDDTLIRIENKIDRVVEVCYGQNE